MKLSDDAAPGSIASVRASTRASRKRSRDVVIESAQLFVKSSRRRAAVSDDEDESDVVATVRAADGGDDSKFQRDDTCRIFLGVRAAHAT